MVEPVAELVVLERLLEAGSQPVSRHALGQNVPGGLRRALDRLGEAGCRFRTTEAGQVQLVASGLGSWADYLRWHLGQGRVDVYRSTATTQEVVRRLLEAQGPAASGAVVIADRQTAGRGRLGRRWVAPPGSAAMFSYGWMGPGPNRGSGFIDRLMLASSVAVADALAVLIAPQPVQVQIKWPNDIQIDGRKVAGILVETFNSLRAADRCGAVIGVGINVTLRRDQITAAMTASGDEVTSLAMCGRSLDRLAVLAEVLGQLDEALEQDGATLVARWGRRSVLKSQPVTVRHAGRLMRVEVVDLDPQEGLIVRTGDGSIRHLPGATTSMA